MKTHYEDLQVSRNASPRVIRAAYKSLAQEWHPDRHPEDRQRAEGILKIINKAYTVLSSPELRAQHDQWINQQSEPDAPSADKHDKRSSEAAEETENRGAFWASDLEKDTAQAQESLFEETSGSTLWIHIVVWSIALMLIFALWAEQ